MIRPIARALAWAMRWPPRSTIARDGEPYLHRYYLVGSGKSCGLFVHHIVASDSKAEYHDHPWRWAISLVLAGGYREQRRPPDGRVVTRWLRPGRLNVLRGRDFHRLDLDGERPAWTLFLHGRAVKRWGFLDAVSGRFAVFTPGAAAE